MTLIKNNISLDKIDANFAKNAAKHTGIVLLKAFCVFAAAGMAGQIAATALCGGHLTGIGPIPPFARYIDVSSRAGQALIAFAGIAAPMTAGIMHGSRAEAESQERTMMLQALCLLAGTRVIILTVLTAAGCVAATEGTGRVLECITESGFLAPAVLACIAAGAAVNGMMLMSNLEYWVSAEGTPASWITASASASRRELKHIRSFIDALVEKMSGRSMAAEVMAAHAFREEQPDGEKK